MDKNRIKDLKSIINSDFRERHDIPQCHFSIGELKWLLDRAINAERMEWALDILKKRTEYHSDLDQINFIAKQGMGEENSPFD